MIVRSGRHETSGGCWPDKTLNEIAEKIQDGTHFSPQLGGTDYRYVTSKNIGVGRLKVDEIETISEEEHRKIYRRCDVRFGDLLLTKDGANTGNAAINTFSEEISLLSSIAFIRLNPRAHDARFFLQCLLSNGFQDQVNEAMAGNAITRLTLAKIRRLKVPVPPIAEQTPIAEALSHADALISSLERLIAKKRDIMHGGMQELITGRTRLPGFQGEWARRPLKVVCPMQRGFDLPVSQLTPGPYPVVFSNGVMGTHNHAASEGPGVITGRSGTIGEVHFIASDYWPHNTALWVTDFYGNEPRFIYYLLKQARLERFAGGSGVPTLNRNDVHSHAVMIPTDSAEQRAIAKVLVDMDAEIKAVEVRLAKTRDTKRGMMQELLNGWTRLAVSAENQEELEGAAA